MKLMGTPGGAGSVGGAGGSKQIVMVTVPSEMRPQMTDLGVRSVFGGGGALG